MITFDDSGERCLIVSQESGTTFEYMKCDFKNQKFSFVEVTHYQLLIGEKVYWQSFKSEEDFFRVWETIK